MDTARTFDPLSTTTRRHWALRPLLDDLGSRLKLVDDMFSEDFENPGGVQRRVVADLSEILASVQTLADYVVSQLSEIEDE